MLHDTALQKLNNAVNKSLLHHYQHHHTEDVHGS